jgi:hypothetical protein
VATRVGPALARIPQGVWHNDEFVSLPNMSQSSQERKLRSDLESGRSTGAQDPHLPFGEWACRGLAIRKVGSVDDAAGECKASIVASVVVVL